MNKNIFKKARTGCRGLVKIGVVAASFLIAFPPVAVGAIAKPEVVAYVFPRDAGLTPGEIDAHKVTRINYAFANIDHGRMVEGSQADAANFAVLDGLRKDNPHLTILVSVGGWSWSGGFSDMALNKATRAVFIASVDAFITRYRLDGLDVDWEYPGMAGSTRNFRAEDTQNYTLLLKELRESFDALEKQAGRRLYLSVAAGASDEFLQHTEMGLAQKYLDTVNLMAYDYYEPGDQKITGNHAPLFSDPDDPEAISANGSVLAYEKAGVPAAKIVLGVPFYGHVWGQVGATNNGLFQAGKPVPNAYAGYGAITGSMIGQGYTRYWDKAALAPYLYNPQKQIFVSYEDPESLALKCKYVLDHHLGGIMFWEYSSDPTGALLNAVDAGLKIGAGPSPEQGKAKE